MPSLQEHGEELRDAALRGDLEEMVRLLNQGAGINGADEVRLVTHVTTSLGTCRIKVTHICIGEQQYDGLGMRPMRPHCVKYVVLLNCVSLCTLLSLCVQ